MLTLYGDAFSGNCYKIQLLLHLIERPYEWHAVDILKGETRSAAFLALSPNGRVPVIELYDGRTLWESNAILSYLAEGSPFLPADPFQRAQVLQWQNFEQYSHEPYIATSRYIRVYLGNPPQRAAELAARQAPGYAALDVMEQHLATRSWFVADRYTIADISLYAYTHVAAEGGFALDEYPHINAWLARVASRPDHIPMQTRPRGIP